MSALEDSILEGARDRIGALVLFTQDSSPRSQQVFLETNTLNGTLDLIKEGYVIKVKDEYVLTNRGWVYARQVLGNVAEMFEQE